MIFPDLSRGPVEKAILKLVEPSGTQYEFKVKNSRQGVKLKNFLVKCGFTDVEYHQMYHEASAFCKSKSGQIYYVHTDDDRWPDLYNPVFIRTAADYKDYHGGSNMFPHTVQEFRNIADHDYMSDQ